MVLPVIPVQLFTAAAAVQQMTNRRAKRLDGDSSSDEVAETFNAVNPSMSAQADSALRQVGARLKPHDRQKSQEQIEDEEERLLGFVAGRFGLEKPQGMSLVELAQHIKTVISHDTASYNIDTLEKDLGLDLIGISLMDFLDAIIDPASDAGQRVSQSFETYLERLQRVEQQALLEYPDATDEELGLYSPFKKG